MAAVFVLALLLSFGLSIYLCLAVGGSLLVKVRPGGSLANGGCYWQSEIAATTSYGKPVFETFG